MAADGAFEDLRKLAEWFSTSPQRTSLQIERITRRLGTTAIPLLGRELRHPDPRRRDAARESLAWLATTAARPRVIGELRNVTVDASDDNTKVCALGLLAELGEPSTATFADPHAMQRRSALALAAQLDTPADVASAADLMMRQLADDDLLQMLAVLVEVAPADAQRLTAELAARLDLSLDRRQRIAAVVEAAIPAAAAVALPRRSTLRPRPTRVAVLVDATARLVIVATRKVSGERRWRRWAVLIGSSGRIEDCLHEDDAPSERDGDAASLIASLCADGYRVASTDLDHARTVVAAAARRTAIDLQGAPEQRERPLARSARIDREGDPEPPLARRARIDLEGALQTETAPDPPLAKRARTSPGSPELSRGLSSAYYLGRDLLDLADAHLGERSSRDRDAVALGRAVELLAAGEPARAQALLERCEPAAPDAAGVLGAALLAQGQHAASIDPLSRAIAAEPGWPLHHWNLAIALHQLGDASGCHRALRRFITTSAQPSGLYADPDQPGRVACAERMVAELQRTARLTGASLTRIRAGASDPLTPGSRRRRKRP